MPVKLRALLAPATLLLGLACLTGTARAEEQTTQVRVVTSMGEFVIEVRPEEGRALVRGVNLVKRHQKQSAQQEGGIISKEAAVHLSNLALADPKDGKATRIGFKFVGEGDNRRKVRVAKRSGVEIDG